MTDIKVEVQSVNEDNVASPPSEVYYRADNTKPTITIETPDPIVNSIINGNQTLTGTASDWSQVEAIYIGYFTSPPDMNDYKTKAQLNANKIDDPGTPVAEKWYKIANPSLNWIYSFNTNIIHSSVIAPLNGYKLYVAALDKVGNVNHVFKTYTIDQDLDKPVITITNPAYTGVADPTSINPSMILIPRTYVLMGNVKDQDGEGVKNVGIAIDLLNADGTLKSHIYPPGAGDINSGGIEYKYVSSAEPMILGTTETAWTYKITNYDVNTGNEFYRLRVLPIDNGVPPAIGVVKTSYFVVSNLGPQVEIITPSIDDPDDESGYKDMYGTVISNVKDDIYWDNNANNNHIYYDDDNTRKDWGWNTDLNENDLNIFGKAANDPDKSDYYRMIFRAKDNGMVNEINISVDGGITNIAKFTWSGGIADDNGVFNTAISDNTKIIKMGAMKKLAPAGKYADYTFNSMSLASADPAGWIYFFVDIDTTKIAASTQIKVIASDNNDPAPFQSTATVQVNVDNNTYREV